MSTPCPARRRAVAPRRRTVVALIAAGSMLAGGALVGLSSGPAFASSHREAPLIANDPAADNTDVYAFVSPDKPDTVTLIANWAPFLPERLADRDRPAGRLQPDRPQDPEVHVVPSPSGPPAEKDTW